MHRLTAYTTFRARHAIRLPDGSFEPMHEHVWRVAATVGSAELDSSELLIDLRDLSGHLERVVDPLQDRELNDEPAFESTVPTAERVTEHLFRSLRSDLPEAVHLETVRLLRGSIEAPEAEYSFSAD